MQRPAEQLVSSLEHALKHNKYGTGIILPRPRVRLWLKLAKSIDARMRLDGSKRNKQKKAGAKS